MTARRLGALLAAATLLAVSGCGKSSGGAPDLAKLPLPPGARIMLKVERCDKGANAFCAYELVVTSPSAKSSEILANDENTLLLKNGWTGANADTGEERAADSPGHKLRVTYASAYSDLVDIDKDSIKRSRKVTLALSQALFRRTPTMSMLLEMGTS